MKALSKAFCFFLFSISTNTKFSVCIGICIENEQQALESLKKEAYDPLDFLSSWIVGKDCCEWEGVVCHNLTRHVIELHMTGSRVWYETRYDLRINGVDHVDLSKATNWLQVINMLPSLVDLRLYNCSLHHIPPLLHHNFSSLEKLDLSWNDFSSSIPKWVFNLPSLVSLDLSHSNLIGPFPEGPVNFTSLTTFSAGYNDFNCLLPRWLFDLNNLEYLELSSSGIEGAMPREAGNVTKLRNLDLSVNNLNSTIPNWIYRCKDLELLYLYTNNIEGVVSNAISNLSSITHIILSKNMLSGNLPNVIGKLSKLRSLVLLGNLFEGEVFELFNSRRNFLAEGLRNSSSLRQLNLENNSFSGGLSHFLCETNKNGSYILEFLNLDGNDLSGEIPDCWMNWPKLAVLILGDNNLIGGIPRSMEVLSNLKSLDLRRNRLTGPLPSSLANCTSLLKIDLAENEFVGQLPPWLGMRLSNLIILSLSSNKFYGELPLEICHLKDLQILDLSNNSFFGIIPWCIGNLTTMVAENKLGEADILYYYYLGNFLRESAMVTTKGNIYQYDKTLGLVTSMDLSNNNLSGDIPISFNSLVGLRICNFSKNHLTGRIPNGIGDMKVLESLDLSKNQLSGQIPQSFSSLSTLSFLNLSYNNLSGKIPVGTQLQSFTSSSFLGNELCGLPLLANCSSGGQNSDVDTEKDESDEDELDWFYIAMSIGFGLSFWGVCSCLLFKRSWRHAYYRFLDSCWESLCVKIQIWGGI